jgi:hypothetical protein
MYMYYYGNQYYHRCPYCNSTLDNFDNLNHYGNPYYSKTTQQTNDRGLYRVNNYIANASQGYPFNAVEGYPTNFENYYNGQNYLYRESTISLQNTANTKWEGHYLDISGNTGDVILWPNLGAGGYWRLNDHGNNIVSLQNTANTKWENHYLDIDGNTGQVILWPNLGAGGYWKMADHGDGRISLQNTANTKWKNWYLDIDGNTGQVILWDHLASGGFWKFTNHGQEPGTVPQPGTDATPFEKYIPVFGQEGIRVRGTLLPQNQLKLQVLVFGREVTNTTIPFPSHDDELVYQDEYTIPVSGVPTKVKWKFVFGIAISRRELYYRAEVRYLGKTLRIPGPGNNDVNLITKF